MQGVNGPAQQNLDSDRVEVERWRDDWLAAQDSPETIATYRWALDEYLDWCARNGIDWQRARRADGDRFRHWLANPSRRGGVCARTTIAKKLSAVSSFHAYVIMESDGRMIEHSPMEHVRRPRLAQVSDRDALTLPEAQAMLAASLAVGDLEAALVHVLLSTGVRVSEACSADVKHLRSAEAHRTLTVVRKGGRKDRLPMPSPYCDVLDAHLAGRTDGPLLTTRRGRLSRSKAYRIVSELAVEVAPGKTIGPHSLRHTTATLALKAGAPLWQVQRMLGHSDPRTTMRYLHAIGNVEDSAVHILAEALTGSAA